MATIDIAISSSSKVRPAWFTEIFLLFFIRLFILFTQSSRLKSDTFLIHYAEFDKQKHQSLAYTKTKSIAYRLFLYSMIRYTPLR